MRGRLEQWVAPVSVRWYAEGEYCPDPVPGDVIFVNHGTFDAKAIELGERALSLTEPQLKGYCWCDHVAFIRAGRDAQRFTPDNFRHYMRVAATPRFIVSEMGPRGHEYRPYVGYHDRQHCVAHFDVSDAARQMVLDNDDRCATIAYGWLEYPALVIDGLTGAHFLGGYGNTMICSTEVALCASGLYWFADRQPSGLVPAHLALMAGARYPA